MRSSPAPSGTTSHSCRSHEAGRERPFRSANNGWRSSQTAGMISPATRLRSPGFPGNSRTGSRRRSLTVPSVPASALKSRKGRASDGASRSTSRPPTTPGLSYRPLMSGIGAERHTRILRNGLKTRRTGSSSISAAPPASTQRSDQASRPGVRRRCT